jgi:hypothetical protein
VDRGGQVYGRTPASLALASVCGDDHDGWQGRRPPPFALHEVINDRSGDVPNLFPILQSHYPQLTYTLRFQITSRREFNHLKGSDPATLTDLERAGRFPYLQRLAFGGKLAGRSSPW